MDVIGLCIRQPVTVAVGVILVLLAGALSLTRLPIQLTPNVETTVVSVTTRWEGASPADIEQSVIDKQEERLLGLSNLRLMTSTSQQGTGEIRLEFITGTDKAEALREASDKLREVSDYPDNVDEPIIEASDPENRDFIAWLVLSCTDPSFDIRTLQDFAVDRIEPALERTPGVAEINVLGGREREVQIRIDPVRLAQYGVPPTRLVQVIRDANQNLSAGRLPDGKLDVRLRTIGQYESLTEIENTVIRHSAAGPVLVRDVADVVMTYKEPTSFVRSKGRPVIAINAEREIGSNVMTVMKGFKAAVARINAPGGLLEAEARRLGIDGKLRLEQVYDQTIYIEDALVLVRNNIWIGGALATLVLVLFLRSVRSVGVVALAIPISVIGAVVAMAAMGRSINVISLAGMAFAVGMVVDNAIVVLENIYRHLEMGKSSWEAARDGTREVWGAVLASTLTTIAVFVPILLIQEEAGLLFRDIALAICAAVALSLVVSITLIPTVAARGLHVGFSKRIIASAVRDPSRTMSGRLGALVYRICGSVTARVVIVAGLTLASLVGTRLLMPPTDYLPKGNRNLVFGMILPPPGYNIDQMLDIGDRIEGVVRPYWEAGDLRDDETAYARAVAALPEVPTFDWRTKRPGPPVVPPSVRNYFLVYRDGILFHGAVGDDPRRVVDLLPLFSHATRASSVPGVFAFPFQVPLFRLGGSTGSAVKVQLAGTDLDEVARTASVVHRSLMRNDDFTQVQPAPSNYAIPAPEIQVRPDHLRLSQLGLTTADVGLAVRAAGDGAVIGEYTLGGETIDLAVISGGSFHDASISDLPDLPLAAPSGHVVTLGSVARIERTGAPEQIARVGRQRSVSFEVTPAPGVALESAIDELNAMFARSREGGTIPPTVDTMLAGSASKLAAVRTALLGDGTLLGTLGSSLVLSLLVVYLLLSVLFQSFLKPLVIMVSVPLATLGGFAALFAVFLWSVTDRYLPMQTLDVLTMLGFVLLIGVVVNNAILLVHQTRNFMLGRGEAGLGLTEALPARRAVAEAVRTRVRPIFMSTFTSVGGMLPLVLMPGSGSELYRGLGSVVVGGLLVSTVFTILLVPLLLSLVLDAQEAMSRPGAAAPAEAPTAEPIPVGAAGGAVGGQPSAVGRSVRMQKAES